MSLTCKYCSFPVAENFIFCPNCGKALKPLPLSTTISKQLYIYALSFLLPPLGLWPGIKYVLNSNPKAKVIGVIAIILTIISIAITIIVVSDFLNSQLSINSQIDQLSNN